MKRFLCLFFSILLVISCCAVGASAAYDNDFYINNCFKDVNGMLLPDGTKPFTPGVQYCSTDDFFGYPAAKFKTQFGFSVFDAFDEDEHYFVMSTNSTSGYTLDYVVFNSWSSYTETKPWFINATVYTFDSSTRIWESRDVSNFWAVIFEFVNVTIPSSYSNSGKKAFLNTDKTTVLYSDLTALSSDGIFSYPYAPTICYNVHPFPSHNPLDDVDYSGFEFMSFEDFSEISGAESPFHIDFLDDNIFFPLGNWFNYILDFLFRVQSYIQYFLAQFVLFSLKVLKGDIPIGEAFKIFFQTLFDNFLSAFQTLFDGSLNYLIEYLSTLLSGFITILDFRIALDGFLISLVSAVQSIYQDIFIKIVSDLRDLFVFLFVPSNFSLEEWFDVLKDDLSSNFTFVNRIRSIFNSFVNSGSSLNITSSFMGHTFSVNGSYFSELRVFVRNGLKCIFAVCTLLSVFRMVSSAFGVSSSSDSGSTDKSDN